MNRPQTTRQLLQDPGHEVMIVAELQVPVDPPPSTLAGKFVYRWQEQNWRHDTGEGAEVWAEGILSAIMKAGPKSVRNVRFMFRDVTQWAEIAIGQPKVVQP